MSAHSLFAHGLLQCSTNSVAIAAMPSQPALFPSVIQELYYCENPGCFRGFETPKGRNSHMQNANSCKGYKAFMKQREVQLHDLPANPDDYMRPRMFGEEPLEEDTPVDTAGAEADDDDNDDEGEGRAAMLRAYIESLPEDTELFMLDEPSVGLGEAGPGPSTRAHMFNSILGARPRNLYEDVEDDLPVDEHPNTVDGTPRLKSTLRDHYEALFGQRDDDAMDTTTNADDHLYPHWAGRIDWEIARWMVKDGIGHGSFDRLLAIEGVCILLLFTAKTDRLQVRDKLGLSYSSTAEMHRIVDDLPCRAGQWQVRSLTFHDRQNEEFVFRYRDIVGAIKSLWSDPDLQDQLVFAPKRVWRDKERHERVYSEMWTGKWWWKIQVRQHCSYHSICTDIFLRAYYLTGTALHPSSSPRTRRS